MSFLNYKNILSRLVNIGEHISTDIYQQLCENDNNPLSNLRTLTSVPNTENENTNITPINEDHNLKMRQDAHYEIYYPKMFRKQ